MPATAHAFRNPATASAEAPEARAELVLEHLRQLPTLPHVAIRLLEATTSDTSSAADVVRLIESDPALTVKILRLIQRASVGAARNVVSVDRAVVLLGFEQVRNAVLSVQMYDALRAPGDTTTSKLRTELWKHALATACAAKLLAEAAAARIVNPDEAFVGGLLHDVGKIALETCLPKSYARVVKKAEADHACICDVEREVLGIDHTVAGKRLMAQWALPQPIVECVWLHHHAVDSLPESVGAKDLVGIVHVADDLVRQHRIGYSGYHHVGPIEQEASRLGIKEAALRGVIEALPLKMEELAGLFDIDDLHRDTVFLQALTAANTELGRANSRLTEAQERLERRSRCLDALRRFSQNLRGDAGSAKVCETIAQVVADLFGADGVVVAARGAAAQSAQFGVWDELHGRRSLALPASAVPGLLGAFDHADTTESAAWRSATTVETAAYQRVRNLPSCGELSVLPIRQGDRRFGAVLAPTADWTQAWTRAGVELEGLTAAFALALDGAAGRESRDRVAEELADVNRRFQAAQADLLRSRSLSMIAAMAAGAAHELNNPLAVISGRAQMLAQSCDQEDDLKAMTIISEQAKRASNIVSELMAFARPEQPTPVPIMLTELLETVWKHWVEHSSLRSDQIEVRVADAEARVLADPAGIVEVLNALLSNALEATHPESARIIINSPSLASDETVRIRIEDNGVGMTREVLEHAFDPFFSHRTAGRGRGMGLSRAQRIVEMNGGRLRLESSPGAGTTAYIDWPAAREG